MKKIHIGCMGCVCVALAAWAAWGAPRNAAPVADAKVNRVIVYPGSGDTVAKLQALGVSKIETYGAYWLAEATETQIATLRKTLSGRVEEVNRFNQIELRDGTFNVKQSAAVPVQMREANNEARRLRLVQFKGPVLPAWLKQLRAIPTVRVINYVPNNAYLVSVRSEAEEKLQSLAVSNGPAQWVGVYQPSFKLPASLQKATGVVEVKIAVLNDETAGTTLQAIHRYALSGVDERLTAVGQVLVTLKLNANDLPALAQLPGVLWMQPGYVAQNRDEVQALVLACATNNAGGPVLGTDFYLSFLANLNFSQTPSDYPVLDICDTGVDEQWPGDPVTENNSCINDSPFFRWHPSFDLPAPLVSPDASCCPLRSARTRYIYGTTGTDTDGHGTRVASVAIGYDDQGDETLNCITQGFTTNMVTNTQFVANCTTQTFCIWDNETPPVYVCTNAIYSCILTTIVQRIFCFTNDASKAIAQPPPWYLSRVDSSGGLNYGFQLGLGVSPFGRFGASSSATAQINPVPVVAANYLTFARISNNSWGEGLSVGGNDGAYDILSQDYDSLTRDALNTGVTNALGQKPKNQEMLFIFAGGNDNGADAVGGYGDVLTTPPATAKNVIAVGASVLDHFFGASLGNTFALSPLSSFGPTRDGRFKPDVVAPGQNVSAAISQGSYTHTQCGGCDPNLPAPYACAAGFSTIPVISELYNDAPVAGPYFASYPARSDAREVTSYSAAAVAGGAQLLWWWFQNQLPNSGQYINPVLPYLLQPSPAMMKAYIINSARYLPITNPLIGSQDKLPSICQGMGMMDLSRMFDSVSRVIRDESTPRAIDCTLCQTNPVVQQTYFSQSGQTYELSGQISDPTQPFRVTLAWTDAPGNPAVLKQLVNDLDLQVTVNGQIYAGNDFDTQYSGLRATPVYDHLNNVESVFLAPNSLPSGSTWSVLVRATSIAGDGVPKVGTGTDQDFALVVYNGTSLTDVLPAGVTANNSCQTAAGIVTLPFTWTNTLSSVNYAKVQPSPLAGRGGIDEFFKISQPSPGTTFTANTYGSGFDTVLSVWYGQCGALVEEVSNNDSSNTFQSAVTFTADGTNDYYIIAEPHNNGPGGTLVLNVQASSSLVTLSPSSLLFADQISGTTSTWQTVTLQNGLVVPLEVQNVYLQGSNATEFVILSDNCTGSQLPLTNGACSINIAFAPTNAAPKSAQLVVVDNATGSPRILPLGGNGLAAAPVVCLSANRLTYNSTFVGATDTVQTVNISNCGTAPLNLTNAVVSGPASSDYFISADTCGGVPFTSATVAPGSNCTFSIDFAPTTNGNRNAVLTFFDDAGNNPQAVLLAGKGCATISMSPATLPAPTAGVAYSQSIIASGGGAPYTYAVSSGGLPGGLAFTAGGAISGNATNIGTFTFQVTATDAYGCTGVQQYTLTVGCPTLIIEPTGLPDGLQWSAYTNTISVIGGIAPFTFTVSAGALPGGTTLNSTNGVLAGTPSVAGPASFTIAATDANGCGGSQSYTITINPTVPILGFVPALLPTFGDVVLGTTGAVQSVTVTNSGTAPLIITSLALTGANPGEFVLDPPSACLGASVPAGATCTVNVRFKPTTSGDKGATVMVYDNSAGNPHSFTVKGAGIAPMIVLSSTSLDFGTQTVNVASAPQRVIVQNTGDGPMLITNVTVICTNGPDFSVVADNCLSTPLQPGDSCSISVSFKPGATLPRVGTLVITGTATNSPQLVNLRGVGAATAPSIGYSPTEVFFGDTVLGTTGGVQVVTVTNAGTASLVINKLSFSGGASNNFFIPYSNCLDGTILPGGTCIIPIRFVPSTAGSTNSMLQILSNAGNGTNDIPVSGSGVGPFISLSAAALNFGTNTVGAISPVQSVIVSNSGNGLLIISSLNLGGLNPGDFSIISSNCIGGSGILPGKTCEIDLTFQTAASLSRSAILSIVGNEMNSPTPVTVALTAVGQAFVCPVITVGPTTLPNAFSKVNYNQNLTGSGSGGLYSFNLTSGQLPVGMTLSAGGVLSGLARTVGTNTFTITATDANGCSGNRNYTLIVTCPTYTILPSTIAQATMGAAYNQPLSVRLPDGTTVSSTLQFDNLTSFGISDAVTQNIGGVIYYFYGVGSQLTFTSTVTVAGVDAAITNLTASMYLNYNDNSQVVAAQKTGIGQLTVKLIGPDKTTVTLTGGNGGSGNNYGVACSPDSSRTTFDDSATTAIADPRNVSPYDGTFRPDVPLSAFAGKTGSAVNGVWTLEVDAAPSFLRADAGTVFCWGLSIASPQITYAVTAGALPPGLTLTVGGLLSGTPTASGSYTSTVTVTDASGCTGSQALMFNVAPTAPVIGFIPNLPLTFGDVVIGSTSAVQSVIVTNLGNGPLVITNLTLTGANTNDFSLSPVSPCLNELLPPGGTCVINVQFAPTASGNRSANVLVFDNSAGNPHSLLVNGGGIAPQMFTQPTDINFGTQTVAVASAPQWVTVSNTGNGPLLVTDVRVISTNAADFTIVTNSCIGSPIQPGDNCSIAVSFKPGATFTRTGTLVITSTASNSPQRVSLHGVGAITAPAISLNPTSLVFGDQLVGTTSAVLQVSGGTGTVNQITIGNPGTAALVIDSISVVGSNAVDFVVTNFGGCVGAAIAPGGTCSVTVAAAPVDSGLLTAAVRIISNAGSGTNDVPVLGSGVAPVMLLSTNALNFGTNTVNGTTPPQTIYIENIGNAVLTITNLVLGGVNPGDFTLLTNATSCLSTTGVGIAILPGNQCQVSLTFRTTTMLAREATLTIASNATNAPQVIALSGVGEPCHIIVLSPNALPAAIIGGIYSQTLTATNGTGSYTFSVASGALPSGLTLSSAGLLAGAPAATGSYSFTVQATDTFGCTGTRSYTLAVNCPAIPILPASLPAATAGVFYNQSIVVATNGAAPYTFSVVGGTLPTGLALAADGSLTGVPTVGGSFAFTVQVQDANSCTSTRSYSIAVSCPTIAVNPATLPNPVSGLPYTQSLTGTNGIAPYFFQITSGALPTGLTLGSRGQISGTPRALGSFTFVVQVQDANGCVGTQSYTVSVACPTLSMAPVTLLDGNKGVTYNQLFVINGSSAAFNYVVTSGTLPPGLTLATSGTLYGTPTTFGRYNFTIAATEASGCTVSQTYTMAITCQTLTVGPAALANAAVNSSYQQSLQTTGGTIPITFAITSGALPTGVTMSNAGIIAGTPITAGAYSFTVTATDANGCTGSQNYGITVSCVPLVLTPQVLSTPIFGVAYSANIIAVGHTGTVSFANTSGSLPPGLVVTSSGVVTGTPTVFGSFTFKVTAFDPVSTCSGDRFYTLNVGCSTLSLGPATLPIGSVGAPYGISFTGSGGRAPYTFVQNSGSLPAGMNLLTSGILTGTPTSASSVFGVTVTDANGCSKTGSYTLILSNACSITMSPTSLSGGTVGVAHHQLLSGNSGTGPYTFMVANGALPAGLTLASTGELSGVPVASGTFNFTAVGMDANGCWAAGQYALTIACGAITVAPASLTPGLRGVLYTNLFTATSGALPATFAVTAGSLPSGITLDSVGDLSGTPTTDGTFNFTVTATDAANCSTSVGQSLVVNPAADLAVSQTVTPNLVTVGNNLTYTIVITNRGPSAASNLILNDTLPASVTFMSGSTGCGATGCNLGMLASGANTTVTITVKAGAEGLLTNTVSVSSSATDLNLADNTAITVSMASNIVQTSAARQIVNASAGQAVVTVVRQGDSRVPATVQYATSDDTAVAGVDYTATAGTLTFNPGDMEGSVVVPLLGQAGSKAGKSVNLVLRNPVGARLGRATTMVTILSNTTKPSMSFTNGAGDVVMVQLTGAGAMAVSLVDGVAGPIDRITLANTDVKSALSIAVKRGRQSTGIVTVGSIAGGSLKSINAAGVNLVGDGIHLTGALGSLLVNGVTNSAVIVQGNLGSVSVNALSGALVAAGYTPASLAAPLAGGTFVPGRLIKSLTSKSMAGSVIAAAQIGKLQFGAVTTNNNGVAFGVLAQAKPSGVAITKPKFNWKANGAADQADGDFHVRY